MAQQPESQTDDTKLYRTTITTSRGTIVMDLDPQLAPSGTFADQARRLLADVTKALEAPGTTTTEPTGKPAGKPTGT